MIIYVSGFILRVKPFENLMLKTIYSDYFLLSLNKTCRKCHILFFFFISKMSYTHHIYTVNAPLLH